MRTQNWKNVERQAAKLFGGTRTGCNGESRRDIEHHDLSIEVKHRKIFPDWLHSAMAQAVIRAKDFQEVYTKAASIFGKIRKENEV